MNIREENEQLREKIDNYEQILEKVMEGPFFSGIVASKPAEGIYRVISDEGKEVLIAGHPNIPTQNLKEGTRVMLNQSIIVKVLPKELEKKQPEVHFDFIEWHEIGGIKSQVAKIREATEMPANYAKLYKEYGLTPSKGVLLYGPPGCGKTMIAKAIASTFLKGKSITKDSFIYMKGGEMLSPYVGVAENNIKSAFDRARRNFKEKGSRSVIFIDEAEAILPARGSRKSSDVETTIVPTFLSEMDGFEENGTFVILATNHPSQLDPAVIRPGRIDLKVEISRPTYEDAIDIFQIYLKKTKCAKPVKDLAISASDYLYKSKAVAETSGALIKNIVDKACLLAIKRAIAGDNSGVTNKDLQQAINESC